MVCFVNAVGTFEWNDIYALLDEIVSVLKWVRTSDVLWCYRNAIEAVDL